MLLFLDIYQWFLQLIYLWLQHMLEVCTVKGSPVSSGGQTAPFRNAMDGDYATYFSKRVGEVSFVGLYLGAGNEAYLTRVMFYPRSDRNFILPGTDEAFKRKFYGEQPTH